MRRSKGLKALAMAVPIVLAVETTGALAAGERFLGRGDAERWGRGEIERAQLQYAGIFEGGKEQAAAAELVDFGLISETQGWVLRSRALSAGCSSVRARRPPAPRGWPRRKRRPTSSRASGLGRARCSIKTWSTTRTCR
jgi:hypothetical protein